MATTTSTPPRAMPFALLRETTMRSLDATWMAAEWEQLPDDGNRYELIDGVLYISTAPSFFHGWIVGQINELLREQLMHSGLAYVSASPVGVYLTDENRLQPDLVVVRREDADAIYRKRIHGAPALLVEVLSPSNAETDLETKLAAYARAGVPEYWIVRPKERDVLIHSEPDIVTGQYRTVTHVAPDGELASPTLPVRAMIAGFFAGSPDTTV